MRDRDLLERITIDPKVMVGKPIIRGTRIPVGLILKMLGQGISTAEVLREYPQLEKMDVEAAIMYAARVIEHEEVFPLPPKSELVAVGERLYNHYTVATEAGIRVRE